MQNIKLSKKGIYTLIGVVVVGLLIYIAYGFFTRSKVTFVTNSPKVEIHTEFDAMGNIESVKDGKKEDVKVDTSKLNKEKLGEYPVTYKYKDEIIEITVQVIDSTAPVFDIKEIDIDLGMEVKANDLVENIQDSSNTVVRFKEKYNFSKVGDVNVVVIVEDASGNKTEKKSKVHVLDKDDVAPEIVGTKDLVISKGELNVDFLRGVTVKDNRDPSPKVDVNSKEVNVNQIGDYTITFTARDRSGNTTKAKHKVSVVEKREIGSSEQSSEKVVYLTFDDGPSKLTPQVLDILDRYNIKATFFVTGLNPDYFYLIKEAHDRGHVIGMHTYSHNYSELYASTEAYYADLDKIADLCKQQIGYVPKYIRFPGGSSNTVSKKYHPGIMSFLSKDLIARGYQYYDWNVSSGDGGGTLPVEEIISYSIASDANNIVLLMHDANGKQSTVDGLAAVIEHYQKQGYRFAGIDDDSFAPHHAINN